jgi:hypothetical protein
MPEYRQKEIFTDSSWLSWNFAAALIQDKERQERCCEISLEELDAVEDLQYN